MITVDIHKLPEDLDKQQFILSHIKNMELDIEFLYGSHFKNAKDLRDLVEAIGKVLNISPKYMVRIILVIDELNNNAIEYGSSNNGENKLRVQVIQNIDSLDFNIEVEDNGKGKAPKKALEMEILRAHQLKLGYKGHASIRGRGLFMIIVKSVDRLYFKDAETGGLIVGVKKNIPLI